MGQVFYAIGHSCMKLATVLFKTCFYLFAYVVFNCVLQTKLVFVDTEIAQLTLNSTKKQSGRAFLKVYRNAGHVNCSYTSPVNVSLRMHVESKLGHLYSNKAHSQTEHSKAQVPHHTD